MLGVCMATKSISQLQSRYLEAITSERDACMPDNFQDKAVRQQLYVSYLKPSTN